MSKKRILCVDDSNLILLMEKLVLSKEGYELVTANDGEQAIERTEALRPDLILLDVVMPRLGGVETCRRLRAADVTVPIIMVTTRGEGESVEAAFRTGCTDYVVKPIDPAELVAKVRSCLGDAQ
jgi:DNA-binding response OmpR family regulator